MLQQVSIESTSTFYWKEYQRLLGLDDMVLAITPDDIPDAWGFYVKDASNTMFTIEHIGNEYVISMDSLATYDDYRLFPYLIDTLSTYLCNTPYEDDGMSIFEILDENWIEDTIGEEIAYLKCMLKMGIKYYIELPITDNFPYITEQLLNEYGVTLHSSTPHIYGYIWYMLKKNILPCDEERDDITLEDIYVDVPQHVSIGSVRSWQTDGAETTESYSINDIQLLTAIGEDYKQGKRNKVAGVVLNDIGTIYENGIGVSRDAEVAIYWYKEAIKCGDKLYAPTSLGDIYRRGLDNVPANLSSALEAYRISEDPYSWYRIGQSYEEGWIDEPDIDKAMEWYNKAAAVGHHLALKRLECEEE